MMKLIVGLGNPGEKYKDTRHNVGFLVIEKLARELAKGQIDWVRDAKHTAYICKTGGIILAKPQTFMNASGVAVSGLMRYYRLTPSDIWVVHDDMDLPVGKIRVRAGGSSAGHHGIDSIIRELKTDAFTRFRLGIGKGTERKANAAEKNLHRRFVIDFVLSRFTRGEAGSVKHLVKYGTEAVRIALTEGIDKAMNRFN